ncbi:hypothetical protein HX882_21555 [Pseudomonas gingeri]|uniref:Uncharacterized protein n=1 Tax=Pseudomonas gingeri TaxID=117681 RepID=A0A7Y7XEK4_9PSED|nr:hypothetical protein [Pseudomonas gingeri]NWB98489.1 hypothetical protein [Pseudomonas gingeri]
MIDSIVGKRIEIVISDTYGPFLSICNCSDVARLEELIGRKYYIPFWTEKKGRVDGVDVIEYYFGRAADPRKLQEILDGVD